MIVDAFGKAVPDREPPVGPLTEHGSQSFGVCVVEPNAGDVAGFGMDTLAPPEPEVTTRRLVLRRPCDSDRLALLRLTDGDDAIASDALVDLDDFLALLEERAVSRSLDQRYDFVVVAGDEVAGPEVVGVVALTEVRRGQRQSASLATWIGFEFASLDYATEAMAGVLGFAFEGLRLHRVEMMLAASDGPMISVARRLGLRDEGLSPAYAQVGDVWIDHRRFAMTAEDWIDRLPALISAWGGG